MYFVKEKYVYEIQLLFLAIARAEMKATRGAVKIFPHITVDLGECSKEDYSPLKGEIGGDLVYGYGVKWLAYLLQEGEVFLDRYHAMKWQEKACEIADVCILAEYAQSDTFEFCPFEYEDAKRFIDMMEHKYPYMPLPIEKNNRKKLVDAFYDLYNKDHYIGISGGIMIEEKLEDKKQEDAFC